MKIVLSFHAKKRLIERGIKLGQIIAVIKYPDYTVKRSDQETEAYKKIKDKTLKVVYIYEKRYIKVITLYYLD